MERTAPNPILAVGLQLNPAVFDQADQGYISFDPPYLLISESRHKNPLSSKPCQYPYTKNVYFIYRAQAYTLHVYVVKSLELIMQNRGYTIGQHTPWSHPMPKQNIEQLTDFGRRLADLRKKAGFTQVELANELGVSQRMISYYEGHSEYPPSNLLPIMARVLRVSSDELLGIKPIKKIKQPDSRLLRRMQQIDKLDPATKRQVIQVMDTFIENAKLKKQA
jgi:transcriptional regulator with XRE-family HTH domain